METLTMILPYLQIGLAILLTTAVLLQQTGVGLSETFGGGGGETGFHTRRGFEKTLFQTTIALGVLFVLSSLIAIVSY